MRRTRSDKALLVMLAALAATAGCQSSGNSSATATGAGTADTLPADPAADPNALALASTDGEAQPVTAMAAPPAGLCTIQLAEGPPTKPAKGADFGKGVAKNTGKAVGRNILTMIGGQLGGGVGAAAASGIASSEIRAEQDIKGTWQITDGTMTCACQLEIGGVWKIQGKGNDKGSIKTAGCSNPAVQKVANWALGYSFTGYDAKFELKAKDNRTVLATLNRDGIHYFSGTLADGSPVVMWRDGQNYSSFRKAAAQ